MTKMALHTLQFKNKLVTFTENFTISSDGWFVKMEFSNGTAKKGAISYITKNRLAGWITYFKNQGYTELK